MTDGASDLSEGAWKLEDVQIVCGTMGMPTATVKMTGPDSVTRVLSSVGTGRGDIENRQSIDY